MKILSVGLGRNGTQSFNQFMQRLGFTTTHFYDFKTMPLGLFEENSYGIEKHFNSLPETDVYSDIPNCLIFDKLYERFPEAKYINIILFHVAFVVIDIPFFNIHTTNIVC